MSDFLGPATQPVITPGAATEYYRGDKTWQALTKAAVGLGSVDNTTDELKPISAATQTALNGKANTTHAHSGADLTSGTIPDARLPTRLGTAAATVTDWDTVTSNGFYFGLSTAANTIPVSGNAIGYAVATATAVTVWAWAYTSDTASDTKTFRRDKNGSTWSAWERVYQTASELDARYIVAGSETVAGRLELATAAETATGTDATRAVHPAGLKPLLDAKAAAPSTVDVTYYVSTTGSNSNDGLTAGTPFLTVQKAVDTAASRSLWLDIKVVINWAAGSYSGRVVFPEFTENRLNIVVQGPEVAHPNVPTVTQTEGTSGSASAFINRNPNSKLTVRNVHFTGYRGTASSSGITVTQGAKLYMENCHFTDCFWGFSGQSSFTDCKGGIFTRCGFLGTSGTGTGAGFRSLMGNVHAVGTQGAGNLLQGPEFVDCKTGGHIQESSTGHVDYCTFKGTTQRGLILRVNSRANVDGSSFAGQAVGITVETGSNAFLSSATAFSGCTNNYVVNSAGSVSGTTHTVSGVDEAFVRQEAVMWGTYSTITHTGTLTETDLANLTLKGGVWKENGFAGTNAPAARMRLQASGTLTGTLGTKTIRIRYGTGIATVAFTATETGPFVYDGYVTFTAAKQIMRAEARRNLGSNMRVDTATTTTDTTVDQTIRLTAQLSDTTDTIVFDAIEISRA